MLTASGLVRTFECAQTGVGGIYNIAKHTAAHGNESKTGLWPAYSLMLIWYLVSPFLPTGRKRAALSCPPPVWHRGAPLGRMFIVVGRSRRSHPAAIRTQTSNCAQAAFLRYRMQSHGDHYLVIKLWLFREMRHKPPDGKHL